MFLEKKVVISPLFAHLKKKKIELTLHIYWNLNLVHAECMYVEVDNAMTDE